MTPYVNAQVGQDVMSRSASKDVRDVHEAALIAKHTGVESDLAASVRSGAP